MTINSTVINTNPISDYDDNGAVMYTIVTLFFYSLSLFCSLILNIDPDDHYYEKKWSVYQTSTNRRTFHSGQADILNILSNESLRKKYWRIYFGHDKFESRSAKFICAESKRISLVLQRSKELNNERIKQSSRHRELDELNRITTNNSQQISPDTSSASFLLKFRRSRSTSVPGVIAPDCLTERRSCDVLCHTPLCKPPTITFTKYS